MKGKRQHHVCRELLSAFHVCPTDRKRLVMYFNYKRLLSGITQFSEAGLTDYGPRAKPVWPLVLLWLLAKNVHIF